MTLRTGRVGDLGSANNSPQDDYLTTIAQSAQELTQGKGWPEGVQELVTNIGKLTKVSVVWVFQILELTDEHILLDYPFEWADCPENANRAKPRFNLLHWNFATAGPVYNAMTASRKRGEWQDLNVPEMDDCPLKDDLTAQGLKSMLTLPIMVEGKWWGLLGLDDFKQVRAWSDAEIALLSTAAQMISSTILQDRLSSKQRQFEILESITESSAWELNIGSGHFWCNPRVFSAETAQSDNIHMSVYDVMRRIHLQDRTTLLKNLRTRMLQGEATFRKDLRILRDNYDYVWVEIIAKIALDKHGKIQKLAGIVVEIPERKAEEEQLRHKATLDPLTGVANRGSFEVTFADHVQKFREIQQTFSLLLLDIDYFKKINDTWGHAIGDTALKHITAILQQNLRDTDHLARIGGEEFAILLPNIHAEKAKAIGERIRKDVEASPLQTPAFAIPMTISIGAANLTSSNDTDASFNTDQEAQEALFQLADTALYAAKNSGRNRMVSN